MENVSCRVMVVDDDEDVLGIIAMYLEECGCPDADTFTNPLQALDHFKKITKDGTNSYTLVLSDIRMPGMNGFELAAELSKIRPDTKIVLMTAFDIDKKMQDSIPVIKCEELLQKPFRLEQICKVVKKVTATA